MKRVISDVMTASPVCVEPETTLRQLVELFSEHQVSGAPVVLPGGALAGVVSATDLVEFIATHPGTPAGHSDVPEWGEIVTAGGAGDEPDADPSATGYFVDLWEDAGAEVVTRLADVAGPEWDLLDEHTVAEIMSRRLISVAPDTAVAEAAQLLLQNSLHRLLVLDAGRLRGVVTSNDLLGVMAAPDDG